MKRNTSELFATLASLVALAALSLCSTARLAAQSIEDLSGPGFVGWSEAVSVSANGEIVVGSENDQAVLWDRGSGSKVTLPNLPGRSFSYTLAVSPDGSVVIGAGYWGLEVFRWDFPFTASPTLLDPLAPSRPLAYPSGVSLSGTVVVGTSLAVVPESEYMSCCAAAGGFPEECEARWSNFDGGYRAVQWEGTTPSALTAPSPCSFFESWAYGVSWNGDVIVGQRREFGGGCYKPFRWEAPGTLTYLGDLGGSVWWSEAWAVSGDGNVVVGNAIRPDYYEEACKWALNTSTGLWEVTSLGFLPGGSWSGATAASEDGSVIVGWADNSGGGSAAFIWDETNGMRSLEDVLATYGVSLPAGWSGLGYATGVSADGRTIVGVGGDPTYLAFRATLPPPNQPPVAVAGPDQSIHAGQIVYLDGSGSYDDNTPSANLVYSWALTNKPVGSAAALTGYDTATPYFQADLPGSYTASLVVTDEEGLASAPDYVEVSSLNMAPTADAGPDRTPIVGEGIYLDGLWSFDPDGDPLTYRWSIEEAPDGSTAGLTGETTATPYFTPDLPGQYRVQLIVNDGFQDSAPDEATLTAVTAEDLAEMLTAQASNTVTNLPPWYFADDAPGHQDAFVEFLTQAIDRLQDGNIDLAIDKLEKALSRTDGCVLRGEPDEPPGSPPGVERDWITDCDTQERIYGELYAALDAISP